MSDSHKWHVEVDEGVRAKALLDDELLQETFKEIIQDAFSEWCNADSYALSQASDAWIRARGVIEVRQRLESLVTTGRMASQQLERANGKT